MQPRQVVPSDVRLIAIVPQAIMNLPRLRFSQYACPSQIAPTFGAHPEGQVAGSSSAVHGFPGGTEAKPLLGRLVSFHFGHRIFSAEWLPLVEF